MNQQGISQLVKQAVSVGGALCVGGALWLLPTGQPFAAVLGFLFLAVLVNARCAVPVPREWWRLTPNESLLLVALLLFGGETAIALSLVTAFCLALGWGRGWLATAYAAAVTVVATVVLYLVLRLTYGDVTALNQTDSFNTYVGWLAIAVPIHAASRFLTGGLSEGFRTVGHRWRAWTQIMLYALLVSFIGACAAGLFARLASFAGVNLFAYLAPVAGVCAVAWDAYRQNKNLSAGATRQSAPNAESEERFRAAFDYAAIGMALVSAEGRWLQVNRSLCRLLDYTERELQMTDMLTVVHSEDAGAFFEHIRRLVRGVLPVFQMELRLRRKTGGEVWVLACLSRASQNHTQHLHLILQVQDITDRKLAEERLQHDAFHDALTGLPNRAMFLDHLRLAIARRSRREALGFAVLYLDVDRFKVINDSLGHPVGDQLLVSLARRLESCLRPGDTVARLGGDEFILLVEDLHDESEAITVAERIQKQLQVPFDLNGREIFATVSIGIASSWTSYNDPEDIVRDADTAMYRAKQSGKARHELFDGEMHARATSVLQLETDLRHALERQEFFIHYQPIVSLDDFKLRGFEALVRWQHPVRGFISPADFIPIAEETGLIIPLGEWVLRESCLQMERWQTIFASDPPLFVAVNLSGKQFIQQDLIKNVARILEETKINAQCLKLEITESMVMDNVDQATEMLKQLRALGLKLSIDDFGTGYSSLSYLHRFPINTLKIDRSFVTRMADNNENKEIVRTIVTLAQTLGMDVVAEGVETQEQLMMLRMLGCENGQGYFFSKPVDAKGAEKIICDTHAFSRPLPPPHPARASAPTMTV
ncbi:MAG TPA: EAL domain-containing protein [Pyrinomonadaceae bacterium]|jgi:diguanylate cyclase (GGDEF)-like protein/PAS domain S-box-containing protein